MNLQRMIGLVTFLGLMHWMGQPSIWADAMQPPRFTLTDLGSVDGQASPYTPPTGYTIRDIYDPDPYKPGHRIGLAFTKDGSANNLLPDYINTTYELRGYNSSGIVFGDDFNTNSSFYYNTNTSEYGNFKGSWVQVLGISSVNSLGQALGATYKYFSDGTALYQATFYSSFLSDPVILQDLLVNSSSDWVLLNGAGLNDNGQIYGTMFNTTTRQSDYYRLDPIPAPVPEPSTIMVFAAGSLLVYARLRFSKNRRLAA